MPAIEVHRLDLDIEADPMNVRADLSPPEAERAMSFARGADRVRHAHTRAALRRLLSARLDCPAAQVPLVTGEHGKPCLAAADAPVFNVAHSGAHALLAIADGRVVSHVGIDIEQARDDIDIDIRAIAELAFTRAEQAAFGTREGFYRGWVLKEALLKAIGVGVAEHLHAVEIRLAPGEPPGVECLSNPRWATFGVAELSAPRGYAAAFAWRKKESS